jgi:hypothetical protein
MIFTPGRSVGHRSFLVRLPKSGPILLTVDAAYTLDHWNEKHCQVSWLQPLTRFARSASCTRLPGVPAHRSSLVTIRMRGRNSSRRPNFMIELRSLNGKITKGTKTEEFLKKLTKQTKGSRMLSQIRPTNPSLPSVKYPLSLWPL